MHLLLVVLQGTACRKADEAQGAYKTPARGVPARIDDGGFASTDSKLALSDSRLAPSSASASLFVGDHVLLLHLDHWRSLGRGDDRQNHSRFVHAVGELQPSGILQVRKELR